MLEKHSIPAPIQSAGAETSSKTAQKALLEQLRTHYGLILHHHFNSPIKPLMVLFDNLLEQLEQSLNALSPKPQGEFTSKEIEALFLDLTLIRVNCISADNWIEDFYHKLKDIGGSADLRAGDIALLSAKAAELALKWANRITEGSV